ncbi:MAG: preprotein translocase subunit SecG [Thermoplasmatales archaeon SG8-52-3]|nr:MAG: preprotein translocase subunit SecG [Thermoplasmatales archaeon SG8-52-3]
MAKQKKSEGFHSAAGLIRYFDAEEKTSLRIPPWFVIALCVGTIFVVTAVNIIWKI